ncbi:MAG: helix-turn-helix domain-containing protein, partial [Raoultibacter sp.]
MAQGDFDRRDDFVCAARELFEEKGLSKTTVKDITEHIGVTRSLFYHY